MAYWGLRGSEGGQRENGIVARGPCQLCGIRQFFEHQILQLENLMVTGYNMKLKDTPFFEKLFIAESPPAANPHRADLATVDRIINSAQYWQSQQWQWGTS